MREIPWSSASIEFFCVLHEFNHICFQFLLGVCFIFCSSSLSIPFSTVAEKLNHFIKAPSAFLSNQEFNTLRPPPLRDHVYNPLTTIYSPLENFNLNYEWTFRNSAVFQNHGTNTTIKVLGTPNQTNQVAVVDGGISLRFESANGRAPGTNAVAEQSAVTSVTCTRPHPSAF